MVRLYPNAELCAPEQAAAATAAEKMMPSTPEREGNSGIGSSSSQRAGISPVSSPPSSPELVKSGEAGGNGWSESIESAAAAGAGDGKGKAGKGGHSTHAQRRGPSSFAIRGLKARSWTNTMHGQTLQLGHSYLSYNSSKRQAQLAARAEASRLRSLGLDPTGLTLPPPSADPPAELEPLPSDEEQQAILREDARQV